MSRRATRAALLVLVIAACGCSGSKQGSGVLVGLATLTTSAGALQPGFDAATRDYTVLVRAPVRTVTVTPTAFDPQATITVNSVPTASGAASAAIDLEDSGLTPATVEWMARDGRTTQVYTIFFRSLAQEAYVKASNTSVGDYYAGSVAISGDTMVVGAVNEDGGSAGVNGNQSRTRAGSNTGAAYVYVREGTSWRQQAYLKQSNPDTDGFGISVAVSGDTVAVGAWGEESRATGINGNQADNSLDRAGAVYVFERVGTSWRQTAYVKPSNTGAVDKFGGSVALSGDTLVVGASEEDSSATGVNGNQQDNGAENSGAAYVFSRGGGGWHQEAYLKASNTEAGDFFGTSVAISNGTIVVGAFGEDSRAKGVGGDQNDNGAESAGAAYVFARIGGRWHQQAYLKASNPEADDIFGIRVGIDGDALVVGAPGESSDAVGVNGDEASNRAGASGAAYVFERRGAIWRQTAYLKASNPDPRDYFGRRLAVRGGLVAVASIGEASPSRGVNGEQTDNAAAFSGAVYVFERLATGWALQSFVKASNAEGNDQFGSSVSLADGALAVGAMFEASAARGVNGDQTDNSATYAGAAYVFRR